MLDVLALIFGLIVGFVVVGINLILALGIAIFISLTWKRFKDDKRWKRFFTGLLIGTIIAAILFLLRLFLLR
jgi:predicted branched-subunit amino acid permease